MEYLLYLGSRFEARGSRDVARGSGFEPMVDLFRNIIKNFRGIAENLPFLQNLLDIVFFVYIWFCQFTLFRDDLHE